MGGTQSLALPQGKGPHPVGCADVMVGHTRQGLFLRLFYPCLPRAGAERPLWIPRYEYCGGLADFALLSRRWCAPLLSVAIGSCRVPVSWKGPFKPCSSGYPLIIFSHGLGAFRSLYSSVCSELASWGFVVAALEHRDHSASVTYFCPAEAGREEWIPYQRVPQGQKEFYFRNKQVHQRAEECVRALQLFKDISSGKSVPNVLHQDFDLSVLKDSVDLTKVAVMGHSFGGVTAVLALVKEPGFRGAQARALHQHREVPDARKCCQNEEVELQKQPDEDYNHPGIRAPEPDRLCLSHREAYQPHLQREGDPRPLQGSGHHQQGCSGLPAKASPPGRGFRSVGQPPRRHRRLGYSRSTILPFQPVACSEVAGGSWVPGKRLLLVQNEPCRSQQGQEDPWGEQNLGTMLVGHLVAGVLGERARRALPAVRAAEPSE
ncbi:platelet-activating factor acetylhydrolase 2, cytoplasmic isoform X1 [Strix aluco]|uniref:platelet-activating factor acetylhydrolase 2, cytoplasmic isoform X1 n=1 Tax=Strix aluco TaxID=111821 RepID=UPI003DA4B4F2